MADQSAKARAAKAEQHIASISSITLDDFSSNSFTVQDLLRKIGGEALEQAPAGRPGATNQPGQLSLSSTATKQLLERYERCEKELAKLQQQVDLKAERLRREAQAEERAFEAQLARAQSGWEAARLEFQDLEGRMNGVTQAATKVGNRLASADRFRQRALEAIERITCLQEFAHAKELGDLPPLFHDDSRLGEAAAMTGKLLALASELVSSRERAGAGAQEQAQQVQQAGGLSRRGSPELGSIEHALEQLELYRNLVDNRVVSRFDAALARQDLPAMAECARTMSQFSKGETVLIQRYISTRPIFKTWEGRVGAAAAAGSSGGSGGGGSLGAGGGQPATVAEASAAASNGSQAGDASTALKGLSGLYKSIAATMRDEAVVMEQVFPSPYTALGLFIQRVFEQKVQTAVDAVLPSRAPPRDASPEALRTHLRLLADAYRKTRALAEELQELVGAEVAVADLADMVLSEPLSEYLHTELRWLSALYENKQAAHRASLQQQQHHAGGGTAPSSAAGTAAAGASSSELSMPLVLDVLSMNEEAVGRCVLLSAPGQVAAHVRQLFHSSTRQAANMGCLLEQVASHLILGLSLAVDACMKQLLGPFRPQEVLEAATAAGPASRGAAGTAPASPGSIGPTATSTSAAPAPVDPWVLPPRAKLEQAAKLAASASLGRVLRAVTTIGAIVKVLQQHYQRVIAPAVASHSGEARACLAGLSALARAVDERVLAALQRALTLLTNQMDLTLVAAQQRSDFLPDEAAPPSLDAPTPACLLVCAMLEAALGEARQHLHGPNRSSFCAELGRRLHRLLVEHMQRQTYSPMGGLRWRRDLAEYAAAAGRAQAQQAQQALEELQALSNLLVVAPDSLLGLADGSLRLSHRTALQYVSLREDFSTARVAGDRTISSLFAGEA